jgi:hypothetical protein
MPDGTTNGGNLICLSQPNRDFRPRRLLIACLSESSARWIDGVQVLDVKIGNGSLFLNNDPIDAECFSPTYRKNDDDQSNIVFDVTAQEAQSIRCFFRSEMPSIVHSAFIGAVSI